MKVNKCKIIVIFGIYFEKINKFNNYYIIIMDFIMFLDKLIVIIIIYK